MTEYAPTTELGLILPIPETGQQWSTQKYIVDNYNKIDVRSGLHRQRLEKLEQYRGGTTVERTAFYGADPTTPTDRATFANTFPTWFNEDKGYWQQYYCQFDDPGVAVGTPAKKTAGWAPSLTNGRVALLNYTVLGTGVRHGPTQAWPTGGTLMGFDGIFSNYPEFDGFEFEFEHDSASVSADQSLVLRAAGADVATLNYNSTNGSFASSAATVTTTSNAANAIVGRSSVAGGHNTVRVYAPRDATRQTYWSSVSADNDAVLRQTQGRFTLAASVFDGVRINHAAGTLGICRARAFGIQITDN